VRTVLVLALVAVPALAADKASRKREQPLCEIVGAGEYRPTTQRSQHADPTSPTGDRFESEDVEFTSQSRTIPRTLDTSFGIRYRLHVPANQIAKVTTRITYPRRLKGKRDWTRAREWSTGNGTLVLHVGYTFDYAWEMSPGPWKMDVFVEDKPACSVTFTVK
jgi:hypothetical protein